VVSVFFVLFTGFFEKNELEKLRNDFQTLLVKYETNKEMEKTNIVNETERKYTDLANKINQSKLDLQG
jgi:hypothetical protein